MHRSIRAIAARAAMLCTALSPLTASANDVAAAAAPLVEPVDPLYLAPFASPSSDQDAPFVWTSDVAFTPPLPVSDTDDSPFMLPGNSPAVPLPAAAWTGLAGLGTISLVKRLRRS